MNGACDVCKGTLEPYRHGWLQRCGTCGVLKSTLEINIPATSRPDPVDEARREVGLEALRRENNDRLLDQLLKFTAASGRLVDVGCGPGFLLRQALERGFAAEGVEPDANIVHVARASGVPVRQGFFPDALDAGETFDAVVLNDVLEHIPDLSGALSACAQIMATGGVLCLNCPERRGFFFQVAAALDRVGLSGAYDRLWQKGLPSPHVWYFTAENLRQAAARHGLIEIGRVRLKTVSLKGLWARIRYVKQQPLALSALAYLFSVATYPLARFLPSDAQALFFRKA